LLLPSYAVKEMTKDKIKLFIVDYDSIFRLGLRTAIAQYADFKIVGDRSVNNDTLRELTRGLILNVLVIGISYDSDSESSLELIQQLRELYPQLPLFVLTPNLSERQLAKIKSWGVRGYCDRSSSIDTIVEGLRAVAYGNTYWQSDRTSPKLWQQALSRLSKTGRIELEQTLQEIEEKLTNPNLSDWERVFLVGRKRELLTARWLSNRLVAEEIVLEELAIEPSTTEIVPVSSIELAPLPVFADSANKSIFERVVTDIQIGLNNRTKIPLEIDILQPAVQKSLCHLIVQRLSETIVRVPIANTLEQNYTAYFQDLWQWCTENFFTRHYGKLITEEEQQLTIVIDREFEVVNQNIFYYIYGVPELFEYLLGKPGLAVDNIVYQSDDPEAIARIEFLLHNLIVQLANGVMQVILNNFYDLEVLKYRLYKSQYRSDRELARFRNQLSWKYRQEYYFTHPQNIFDSRHRLFVISGGFIRTIYIYAPRKAELEQLTGIPWLSTITIETRDAIAPLVRKLIALAGTGVVFVLTQIIGKGLGLIGKGIIQGIGSTIKDVPYNKRNKPR
jgi:DNA-binding NarL/FixJ family response regulator